MTIRISQFSDDCRCLVIQFDIKFDYGLSLSYVYIDSLVALVGSRFWPQPQMVILALH